ncbi:MULTISPECIES: isocitrate lyase/PEP mutase family protein [Halocynthiibacter]|uniref:Isocitrate lyase/phosphoenolpyruvate mutase family protein n=1 Tax=Halocynthiibacter halioticoli TaxID=2986804 RepID=A0AAE3IY33_9RHOB|nr:MULTISPECIES: isocitrate lyase/phosphoenolpyruvate mutase family protein [Halocynthiibacter]MCV6824245.1 isocitrate lyase/phosphoenolpyruvate mutase family protein [Halocynthiibacter halioticoli]MCW4057246.1 isocitrate lyase/phosphoenolpyruvate mutase family protein [Halocynthiibacter sp. SDUM655004]
MPQDQGAVFRALHRKGAPFVLANAWDIGSAKVLANLGARAIATSSAAHAFTLGLPDGTVTRDQALAHAQELVAAVNVPVSGDFENGFGDDPETVAETVRLAAEVGLAGICIEDTRLAENTTYERDIAVERIRAAAAAARALPQDFFLVARADGVMLDLYDHAESLARIQAFEAAGADGLYVPMPKSWDDLKALAAQTSAPLNALCAGPYAQHGLAEYAEIGVARISLGSALARATHRTLFDAATAMLTEGDFTPLANGISGAKIDALLKP